MEDSELERFLLKQQCYELIGKIAHSHRAVIELKTILCFLQNQLNLGRKSVKT